MDRRLKWGRFKHGRVPVSKPHLFAAASAVVAILALLVPAAGAANSASGRAWELVTPSKPNSAKVAFAAPLDANDGRILYGSLGPLPEAPSGALISNALALRGGASWSSASLGFPYSLNTPELLSHMFPLLLVGLSDDNLTEVWLSQAPLLPGAPPEGEMGLYRKASDGTLSLIADLGPQSPVTEEMYVDLSSDGAHTVFIDEKHLLPSDAGRTEGVSIYDSTEGGLQQVDVSTGGSLLSSCGSAISRSNGVSENGGRIFFSSPDPLTACPEPTRLYLREGGATIEVSGSQCSRVDCNAPADIEFAGATPSGSNVFLKTTQQLTDEDIDEALDLYRYQVGTGILSLISEALPAADGVTTAAGVVSASEDGSHVYFCADGRLTVGEGAESGENLYLADEAGLHFVASIPCPAEVQLARNGLSALLATPVALDASDTDEKEDVYLYDADANAMTLLSLGSSGGNGEFDASFASGFGKVVSTGNNQLFRSITEDAGEVFLTTDEQLVAADVNTAVDVYEWTGGHLGLVSSGIAEGDAWFSSVNPDGRTVLIETTATFLPVDVDGGDGDLYVARKGGGFPEAEPMPVCVGTSCDVVPPGARIERNSPASSAHRRKRKGRIRLLEVVRGEVPMLTVSVPQPGLVSVSAKTWNRGRMKTAANGSAGAIHPGRVKIALVLRAAARRILAREDPLRVHLVVRQADLRLARTISLDTGGSR